MLIFFFVILNILIILFEKPLSKLINIYDIPNKRKIHKKKIPRIGGLYLFINIFFYWLFLNHSQIYTISSIDLYSDNLFYISLCFIFFLGFLDDKIQLNFKYKLLGSILIVILLLYFEKEMILKIIKFKNIDYLIILHSYDFFFTTLCFIIFINALNMFDGINGQAILYSLTLLIVLSLNYGIESFFIYTIMISLIGILYLNLKNKLFLGDGGTLLLGFVLSYTFVSVYNSNKTDIFCDEIFLLMLLPGIDMIRLFVSRIAKKQNPFKADSNHFHHYLIRKFSYNKSIFISTNLYCVPIILYYFFNINFFVCLGFAILSYILLFNYISTSR